MRQLRAVVAASVVALGASACNFGGSVSNLPLPGGGASGAETYKVVVIFPDVADLVPKAFVRVNDVPVGEVDKIKLDKATFKARVELKIKKDVKLPGNAMASLRQTSLLGEKFVALGPPEGQKATGELVDGAVIPEDSTSRYPEVEEFFAAFSALATGGGLGQLQTIVSELSTALAGREQGVRDLLGRLTAITKAVDERKGDIVRALDNLDRLTSALSRQRNDIAAALDAFTPAVGVLAAQRADLTSLLSKLATLGDVGARVVNTAASDTIADFKALAPVLQTVSTLKTELAQTLKNVDDLGVALPNALRGDYLNLKIQLEVRPDALAALPGVPNIPLGKAAQAEAKRSSISAMLLGGLR